jgi:hypothetical protein
MSQRYDAMMVVEYEAHGEKKSRWTKIGAGFVNRDGSIGVQLDAIPVGGKIILQIPMTKEEKDAKFGPRNEPRREQTQPKRGGFVRRPAQPAQPAEYQELPPDDDDLPFPE